MGNIAESYRYQYQIPDTDTYMDTCLKPILIRRIGIGICKISVTNEAPKEGKCDGERETGQGLAIRVIFLKCLPSAADLNK